MTILLLILLTITIVGLVTHQTKIWEVITYVMLGILLAATPPGAVVRDWMNQLDQAIGGVIITQSAE